VELEKFRRKPVMGIVRGVKLKEIEPLIETSFNSGLETIEITMNTPDAAELIKKAVQKSAGRMTVGAGTVTDTESLKRALGAGASFIVMPVIVSEVIGYCVDNNVPVFPGALTPNEILAAWRMGASMVKVFPVKFFGPDYIREIKGPFNEIDLLACGGVTPLNFREYMQKGASAVAFGGSVFRKDLIEAGEFEKLGKLIAAYFN